MDNPVMENSQPNWQDALADMERRLTGGLSPVSRSPRRPQVHYSSLIATAIYRLVNRHAGDLQLPVEELKADRRWDNHAYGVKQLRVVLPGHSDEHTVYRVLIAPADAPISIDGIPADEYFSGPLIGAEPAP